MSCLDHTTAGGGYFLWQPSRRMPVVHVLPGHVPAASSLHPQQQNAALRQQPCRSHTLFLTMLSSPAPGSGLSKVHNICRQSASDPGGVRWVVFCCIKTAKGTAGFSLFQRPARFWRRFVPRTLWVFWNLPARCFHGDIRFRTHASARTGLGLRPKLTAVPSAGLGLTVLCFALLCRGSTDSTILPQLDPLFLRRSGLSAPMATSWSYTSLPPLQAWFTGYIYLSSNSFTIHH